MGTDKHPRAITVLRNHGAIAPRYWADFVVLYDLRSFSIRRVYKKGSLVRKTRIPRAAGDGDATARKTMNLRYRGLEIWR